MSNQILKLVAAMMLIGSLILIAVAYHLSSPPPNEPVFTNKEPEKIYQIVTANRNLQPGEIISESDVALTSVATRPPDTFDAPKDMLGKRLTNSVLQGKPIARSDFAIGNPLVQSLKANERAIAIKVDELIGVGGFIQPGDSVDVVAFIRGDNQRIKENQAAIVLHNVRILTYGEELPANKDDKEPAKNDPIKGKTGRNTAVIAIDAEQTPLLALAENSAVLRLALRPTGVEDRNLPYPIALSDIVEPPQQEIPLPEKPQGPLVEIYHGTHVEQVQYP